MSPKRRPPWGPAARGRTRRPPQVNPREGLELVAPLAIRPEEEAALLEALAPLVPAAELAEVAETFRAYLRALVSWNIRSNLVAAGDRDRLVRRHVVESLACVTLLDELGGATLIDLGSGGGFPGIPIKLVRPALQVALLESRRMKSLFLRRAIRELGLSGAEAWQIRIEALAALPPVSGTAEGSTETDLGGGRPVGLPADDLPRGGPRRRPSGSGAAARDSLLGDSSLGDLVPTVRPVVDLVTARAVAALPKIAEWVAPLVRGGGHLVTFKGSRVDEELEAWGRSPGPWGLARVEREAIPGLTLVALRRAEGP